MTEPCDKPYYVCPDDFEAKYGVEAAETLRRAMWVASVEYTNAPIRDGKLMLGAVERALIILAGAIMGEPMTEDNFMCTCPSCRTKRGEPASPVAFLAELVEGVERALSEDPAPVKPPGRVH